MTVVKSSSSVVQEPACPMVQDLQEILVVLQPCLRLIPAAVPWLVHYCCLQEWGHPVTRHFIKLPQATCHWTCFDLQSAAVKGQLVESWSGAGCCRVPGSPEAVREQHSPGSEWGSVFPWSMKQRKEWQGGKLKVLWSTRRCMWKTSRAPGAAGDTQPRSGDRAVWGGDAGSQAQPFSFQTSQKSHPHLNTALR